MIIRSLSVSIRRQDWFTVLVEIVIVVVGVFLGIQVSEWSDERKAQARRAQVSSALVTDLKDAINVSRHYVTVPIDDGITAWQAAFERGEQPPPFFFLIVDLETDANKWGYFAIKSLVKA